MVFGQSLNLNGVFKVWIPGEIGLEIAWMWKAAYRQNSSIGFLNEVSFNTHSLSLSLSLSLCIVIVANYWFCEKANFSLFFCTILAVCSFQFLFFLSLFIRIFSFYHTRFHFQYIDYNANLFMSSHYKKLASRFYAWH